MMSVEELQKELQRPDITFQEYGELLKSYLSAIAEDRAAYSKTTAALTAVVKELLGFYVHCKEEKLPPEDFKIQTFSLLPNTDGGYTFGFTLETPDA